VLKNIELSLTWGNGRPIFSRGGVKMTSSIFWNSCLVGRLMEVDYSWWNRRIKSY